MSSSINKEVTSSKDILRRCGFSEKEISTIAGIHGTDLCQMAEVAEQLTNLKLSKEMVYTHLLTQKTGQKAVQNVIKTNVSKTEGSNRRDVEGNGEVSEGSSVDGPLRASDSAASLGE